MNLLLSLYMEQTEKKKSNNQNGNTDYIVHCLKDLLFFLVVITVRKKQYKSLF